MNQMFTPPTYKAVQTAVAKANSLFGRLIGTLAMLAILATTAQAQTPVAIDGTNFPDEKFREAIAVFDTDNNNQLSSDEIAAVRFIDVFNSGITNLNGIKFFTALDTLVCSRNTLSALNLSLNTNLVWLECSECGLTELNLATNTKLTHLKCSFNAIDKLELQNQPELLELVCENTQLTELDLSNCPKLTSLICKENQLSSLNISACTLLEVLNCSDNQLSSLDLSNHNALMTLSCENNQLTDLKISAGAKDLHNISCSNNNISTEAMQAIVNNMQVIDGTILTDGYLSIDRESITAAQLAAARSKGWSVLYGTSAAPYRISLIEPTNGTISCEKEEAGYGESVHINVTPDFGYVLEALVGYKTGTKTPSLTIDDANNFQMPNYDVSIDAFFKVDTSMVFVSTPTNGTLTVTPNGKVPEGTEVTVEATPTEGYKVKALKVYKTGEEGTVIPLNNGKFNKPSFAVTVTVDFEAIGGSTGLHSIAQESLSVSPNPTQGAVTVEIPATTTANATVLVYNTNGQQVLSIPTHGASGSISIDLSKQPAGVYLVRIGNAVAKVVRQ